MILRLTWRASLLLGAILFITSLIAILSGSQTNAVVARYSLNDVFVQGIDQDAHIFIHDLTTDFRIPLTAEGTRNLGFIDTPDRQHSLFISDDCQGRYSLCQMDQNGHNKQLLSADLPRNAAPGTGASWSPDGTRLAFVSPAPNDARQPTLYIFDYLSHQLEQAPTPIYMDWDAPLIWERDSRTLLFVVAHPSGFVGYQYDVEGSTRPKAIRTWLKGSWNARGNVLDAFGNIFLVKSQESQQSNHDLYLLDMSSGAASNLSNTPLISEVDAIFAETSPTLAVISAIGDWQMLSTVSADWSSWHMLATSGGAFLATPRWVNGDTAILYHRGTTEQHQACIVSVETYQNECPLMWTPNIVFLETEG